MTFEQAMTDVMTKSRCAWRAQWPSSKYVYRGLAGVAKTSVGMTGYVFTWDDFNASDWSSAAGEPDNGANPALVLERRAVTLEAK